MVVYLLLVFLQKSEVQGTSPLLDSISNQAQSLLGIEPVEALRLANEAVDLAKLEKDTGKWALGLKQQGVASYYQGHYGLALGYYEESLALYRMLGDTVGQWACHNNIGLVHDDLGDQNQALQYHLKALELAKEGNLTGKLASSLANMGNVRVDLKDYDGAILAFKEALALHQIAENPTGISHCYTGIAGIFTELDAIDSSLYYRLQAWPTLSRYGTPQDIVPYHINLGATYIQLEEFDSAKVHLSAAEKDLAKTGPRMAVHFYNTRGFLAHQKGRYPQAHADYLIAFQLAKEHGLAYQANWLRLHMARNLHQLGRFQSAFDTLYSYAEVQAELTQLSSETYMKNLTDRFQAQQERDSLVQLQAVTALEADANAARVTASRAKLILSLVVGGFLVFFLVAGFIFFRYRTRQKQIANDAKRIDLEHRLLRSHMAPHFLYNSMNAIQHFIGTNDTFQAEIYLAKFARLMRANLNHTRLEKISLAEELEALQDYIELEQFRFEGKFAYEIDLGETVDLEMTLVPPLLLQPHVENAILHGLRPLKENGRLLVKVRETGELLKVVIEDNGIGRIAAGRNTQGVDGHRSAAMEITTERLAGLNHMLGYRGYRKTVEDLKDHEGRGKGTRITIYYPI